jgi:hypothetical protein
MNRVAINEITAQRAMYQEITVPVLYVANNQVAMSGAGREGLGEGQKADQTCVNGRH